MPGRLGRIRGAGDVEMRLGEQLLDASVHPLIRVEHEHLSSVAGKQACGGARYHRLPRASLAHDGDPHPRDVTLALLCT